jgi:hypothetical protein
MSLAVVKRNAVNFVAVIPRDRHHRGGVQSTTHKDDCFFRICHSSQPFEPKIPLSATFPATTLSDNGAFPSVSSHPLRPVPREQLEFEVCQCDDIMGELLLSRAAVSNILSIFKGPVSWAI